MTQSGGPFNTTGVIPWWSYHEDAIPGGGRLLVNVGLGNVIAQDDDMALPHKGVPLTFRRTYNAQGAAATVTGAATNWTGLYGNGWTNTFDAHLLATSTGVSVYDIDGARYDYAGNGSGAYTSQTPGQHGTLSYDGGCGVYWVKPSGMIFYFFEPTLMPACWMTSANLGYLGRLYAVFGRNYNTYLVFGYYWDNGNASANGKISAITAQTESGSTARLTFTDVNGRRLLQTLTFPDNLTTVSYGYDSLGNLTSVTKPTNNSAGMTRQTWYGYTSIGSDSVMSWAASPRWAAQCNVDNCGGDGAYVGLAYSGSSAATSSLTSIQAFAVVNPAINDGYATYGALQPGHATYAYPFRTEYYTAASWDQYTLTGQLESTFRDTDGHMVNWVVDSAGRPVQTQTCKASAAQGTQCGSTSWLSTNQGWDANNNLTSVVDSRGAETDIAYDAAGNAVAIAQPPQYQGYSRPTTLVDYDAYNNVTAVCDPALVHSKPADWNGQYSGGSDAYCSSQFPTGGHPSTQYTHPSYEPYGELTSMTSAGGYTRQAAYNITGQGGGADYGLPTSFTSPAVAQFDGTSRQSSVSLTYDANGNVVCRQIDAGINSSSAPATTVITYDALNRAVASADPDDASLPGSCSKAAGIPSSAIVTRSTFYSDGSIQSTQTPSQAATTSGTVYTYDLDGNRTSEGPYVGSPSNPQTATTRRWFDGLGRLVETQEPPDPSTSGDLPISMRYLYDLSQNGTSGNATALNGTTVSAYGNLFDVLKNTPTGWTDLTFSAFDSSDRLTTSYAFAPCPEQPGAVGAIYCAQPAYATHYYFDSSTANPYFSASGMLVATVDGLGVTRMIGYDGLGTVDSVQYSGDGGHTPQASYAYDYDERLSDMWNSFSSASAPPENHVSFAYNVDGNVYQKNNTTLSTVVGYAYYPDATLAGVSAIATSTFNGTTSSIVNQPNLYQYAYRNDYALAKESLGAAGQAVSWAYTLGGRMISQSDFGGAISRSAQYSDGHGRLSSYSTPGGNYGSFVYDAFGRMTRYTDPYATVDGETVNSTYNIRGDLVARSYSGGTASAKPGFQYKNIQGVLLQNPTSDQWDGRTGAMLSTLGGPFSYDTIGRMTSGSGYSSSALSYDGENRVIAGDTFGAASAEDFDCHSGGALAPWVPPAAEQSYLYDGLGRMFQDRQPNTTVLNHTITHIRQWIWSGDSPLFAMNMISTWNGAVGANVGYGADGLGSIDPTTGSLTLSDSDFDGAIAQYHNNTGHSAWNATNPFNQFCVSANGIPASSSYNGPSNAPVPDDGSSDPSLTVSSMGRAYLSRSMGFTTPDYSSVTPYAVRSASSRDRQIKDLQWNPSCPSMWWDTAIPGGGGCSAGPPIGEVNHNMDPLGLGGPGGGGGVGAQPKACTQQVFISQTALAFMVGVQRVTIFNQDNTYNFVGPYFGFAASAIPPIPVKFPVVASSSQIDVLHSYTGGPVDASSMFSEPIVNFGTGNIVGANVMASSKGGPDGGGAFMYGLGATLPQYGGGVVFPSQIPFLPAKGKILFGLNLCNDYLVR